MKFVAAFLIATVLVSAVMCAEEAPAKPSKQAIKDALITKAKELKAKIAAAIKAGKGKAEEVIKQLGQNKEQALAKLTEMKAQLQAKLKEVVIPAYGKAKKQAAMKLKAQLAKAIKDLEAAKAKLEKLQ